ncbi:hypothetical protein Ae406Ps2_5857c [Pseudonocardia sp. Ae406_Ps2]|nr:hypothetical protein Ae406Ps2_5857c [Pseudonocardia sp. Ae406_Ps2]OLM14985.1 hypothetical protein Ae505Ps2_5117 [Pseudonocardia sp. Ae505_Ps2]OLM27431.1 hypothetical protein Ae706Ps2_5865c [Pseudonocardia sp. Ae706_Ps2]
MVPPPPRRTDRTALVAATGAKEILEVLKRHRPPEPTSSGLPGGRS